MKRGVREQRVSSEVGSEGKSITGWGGGLERKPGNVERLLRVGRVV